MNKAIETHPKNKQTDIEQQYQTIFKKTFGDEPDPIERILSIGVETRKIDMYALCIIGVLDLREKILSLSQFLKPKRIKEVMEMIMKGYAGIEHLIPSHLYPSLHEDFTDTVIIFSRALTQGYRYLRQTGQLEDSEKLYAYTQLILDTIQRLEALAQIEGTGNKKIVRWGATKESPGSVFFTCRACIAIHNILRARIVDLNKKDQLDDMLRGVSTWLVDIMIDDQGITKTEENNPYFPEAASGHALQAASEIFKALDSQFEDERLSMKCKKVFKKLTESDILSVPSLDWLINCPANIKEKTGDKIQENDPYRNDDSGVYAVIGGLASWMELEPTAYYTPAKRTFLKSWSDDYIRYENLPSDPYKLQSFMHAFEISLPVIVSEEVSVNLLSLRAGLGNFISPLKASDSMAEELFSLLIKRFK